MINNSTNESYSTSSASSTYHDPTVEEFATEDQSCTSSGQVNDLKPCGYTDETIEAIEKENAAQLNRLITGQKITRQRILTVSIEQKNRLRDSVKSYLNSDQIDPKKRYEYQNIYNSLSNDIAGYQLELELLDTVR